MTSFIVLIFPATMASAFIGIIFISPLALWNNENKRKMVQVLVTCFWTTYIPTSTINLHRDKLMLHRTNRLEKCARRQVYLFRIENSAHSVPIIHQKICGLYTECIFQFTRRVYLHQSFCAHDRAGIKQHLEICSDDAGDQKNSWCAVLQGLSDLQKTI